MKRLVILTSLLLSGALAHAQPYETPYMNEGFSIQVGIGAGLWNLNDADLSNELGKLVPARSDSGYLTGTLDHGLALRLAVAYNILGYASVELGFTGHGWNLGSDMGGSGHLSGTAHWHPLTPWLPRRKFDTSVFFGGGWTIVGGGRGDIDGDGKDDDRAMDGGSIEFGWTGRYFVRPYFSVGADLRFTMPFMTTWVVDWDEDVSYDLGSAPGAMFIQILFVTAFHFVIG